MPGTPRVSRVANTYCVQDSSVVRRDIQPMYYRQGNRYGTSSVALVCTDIAANLFRREMAACLGYHEINMIAKSVPMME